MKAYTVYPINDTYGQVKMVEVLSYDRNKYAVVQYNGEHHEIKQGYIWKDDKLTKRFTTFHWAMLPHTPDGLKPSQLRANMERKHNNRDKRTIYWLCYANGKSRRYKNVLRALDAFAHSTGDRYVIKERRGDGWAFASSTMIEVENGQLACYPGLTGKHWRRVYRTLQNK